MGFMNLGINLLIYEDQQSKDPKVRTPDITRDYQGIGVSRPKSEEHYLAPGEMTTIAATLRPITLDNTTEFALSRPRASEDVIRLSVTGGQPAGFRTRRALGVDATTEITMTRVAPNTVRVASTAGTALNTAAVQVGDILKFERTTDAFTSLFSPVNTGMYWLVQAKGPTHIDFLDNGAAALDAGVVLGADFAMQLRVMSPGAVRRGDTVELSGGLNLGNKGKWAISDLADDYVEFVNPFAVDETFTNTNNVAVYDRLIGFLFVRATGPFTLRINGDADGVKYRPICGEALFLGSVEAHTVEASNEGAETIRVTLQQASLM